MATTFLEATTLLEANSLLWALTSSEATALLEATTLFEATSLLEATSQLEATWLRAAGLKETIPTRGCYVRCYLINVSFDIALLAATLFQILGLRLATNA